VKNEKIDFGDRVAAAFVMFFASFITVFLIWLLISYFFARGTSGTPLSFNIVLYFSGFFTFLSFIASDLSLNIMSSIWKKIDALLKGM
jgi:hypothetical protein